MELFASGAGLLAFLLYLKHERERILDCRRRIPLRVAVTGTRGKSTVVRLLTSILREAGYRVLGKTTGTLPVIIYPDGSEKVISRRGAVSLLEQKNLMALGAELKVGCLVAELMSIRPESIYVESVQLLRPNILIVTNTFPDHLEHWGETRAQAVRVLASAVPHTGTVFLPEEEPSDEFGVLAASRDSRLVRVPESTSGEPGSGGGESSGREFESNYRMASAAADFLLIDPKTTQRGMNIYCPDFGALSAWQTVREKNSRFALLVSAFAANEPDSTGKIWQRLEMTGRFAGRRKIALLSLRRDRADRTFQWLRAMTTGGFPQPDRLILTGPFSRTLERKLKRLRPDLSVTRISSDSSPSELTRILFALEPDDAVFLGIGNMAGTGRALVEYWEHTYDRCTV